MRREVLGSLSACLHGRASSDGTHGMRRLAPRPDLPPSRSTASRRRSPRSARSRMQTCWGAVVGEAIAAAAHPLAERDGVLTVECEAAVWAQELDLMAPELLGRLNAALGEERLRRLRCRSA